DTCTRCMVRLSLFLSFFFSCCVHHRDLHSFPTRRSSDLGERESSPNAGRAGTRHEIVYHRGAPVAGEIGSTIRSANMTRARSLRDRKSTRLNSSHDQISYAVFCLKKKKKPSLEQSPPIQL